MARARLDLRRFPAHLESHRGRCAKGVGAKGSSRALRVAHCAPSMGATLRVQVPPRGDHPDRSESQLRKGDRPWGGSGERNRGPMYKNRIGGGAERGERAMDREALMVEAQAA